MDHELKELCPSLEETEGGFSLFKDSVGRFRTLSLFWETRLPDYPAFFSVKKRDHEGCISLYRKYMEYADPTEYSFAMELFGSWDHWLQILNNKSLRAHVDEWRAELKTRMESERFLEMKRRVLKDPDSPVGMQASRWLHDNYGSKSKRGRPSKGEVEALAKQELERRTTTDEDARRIGLVKSG